MRVARRPTVLTLTAGLTAVLLVLVGGSAATGLSTSSYLLGPGDSVAIAVQGEPDLTRTVTVSPDGTVTLPLLGEITVAGLTTQQVSEAITAGLKPYLRDPIVTVTLMTPRATFIYLLGGVVRPGAYEYRSGWTLLEALASAGGLAPTAAVKKAVLIRQGEPAPMTVDLERLLAGDQTANLPLVPGDVVLIPLGRARVLVLGMVRSPGIFDIDEETRVMDVLLRAGGPNERAALHAVGVIRQDALGQSQVLQVNIERVLQQGDRSQNILVRDTDIVFVPEVNRVNWRDVLAWVTGLRLIFGPAFLSVTP